ncbi:MarR family transcriptional regulator [Psychrosphaera sp. B3R10]|uniref:HVO_A0114 family putative DNA-binding protein n=1 Tax=unclassified Psychrosphaera TaxID=2641570 RepID=UPI001C0A63AB|nr:MULTISPECIES: MarR family transcriptional regulator [unclassified Psychrosphaera]MBU2882831.1 MarR family transcriptional regulator [Psychrosphaera sp. I2R16]MBU2988329.1 MarR family transcriptional regulator [Psychrosphaera sp. B3R10]MDO6718539.1 MarR family transcriptional regulator [Psychrosphaera sp. 1_MG-2023]
MKARIGIMPEKLIRMRVLAIAQGKYKPAKDEPKVWYTSFNAISQVLNPENVALLRLIDDERPQSVTELAEISGRKKSNLSNTLKALSEKGFVRMEQGEGRSLKPVALYTDFEITTMKELEDFLLELEHGKAA